jgi:hypothetical protein
MATGGVCSPPHHCVWYRAHTCCDRHGPFKQPLLLTSGPESISYFQSFSITRSFKFELVSFPMSKIQQILQVDIFTHKEKLYFVDQLQNPTGLQGLNSGTNSNRNFLEF